MDIKTQPRLRIVDKVPHDAELSRAVQLYVEGTPFLALGYGFHGQILDKVLEELEIPFNKVELGDKSYHAERSGDLYVATGMGGCFKFENVIKIRGPSAGYGIGPDPEHLENIKPFLKEFELSIYR